MLLDIPGRVVTRVRHVHLPGGARSDDSGPTVQVFALKGGLWAGTKAATSAAWGIGPGVGPGQVRETRVVRAIATPSSPAPEQFLPKIEYAEAISLDVPDAFFAAEER